MEKWAESVVGTPARRLVWGIVAFLLITLPGWLSGIWSLFSAEPFFPFISDKLSGAGVSIPNLGFSARWVSTSAGLLMLAYISFRTWKDQRDLGALYLDALRKAGGPPQPLVLSPADKDAVARIRKLWLHEGGAKSAQGMVWLLEGVRDVLGARWYVGYLQGQIDRLSSTGKAFEETLDHEHPQPLTKAIDSFNTYFASYLRSAELLYNAHCGGDVSFKTSPFKERREQFLVLHQQFWDSVVLVTEYAGINRRLRVFAVDGALFSSRKFLGEHPWDDKPGE